MNKWSVLGLVLIISAAPVFAEEKKEVEIPKDMMSYSVGFESGRNFRRNEVEIDVDQFLKGLKTGLEAKKPEYSEKEMRRVLNRFQTELRKKMAANRREASSINKAKETEYLAANKKKPGVTALSNGLQYSILKEGNGKKPTDVDFIVCNYRITLLDGEEFDKNDDGKPATIKVSQLIPGWREAVKLMSEGSKWHIVIPAKLGYGERGIGSEIGPNTTLVLDLDLVGVKPNQG